MFMKDGFAVWKVISVFRKLDSSCKSLAFDCLEDSDGHKDKGKEMFLKEILEVGPKGY